MKVLHLIDSGGLYGAEKMLLTLAEEQKSQGLDVIVLSSGDIGVQEKKIEIEARKNNIPIIAWRMRGGLNFKQMLEIVKWAKKQGVQLLHCHGYKFNILLGFMPRFLRKIPVVTTIHGYTSEIGLTRRGLYFAIDSIALRFLDAVVYVSNRMGRGKPMAKRRNTYIIPNGIKETNRLDSRESLSVELTGTLQPFILFVGRLSVEKGADLLIKAFANLRLERDIRLVLVGKGEQEVTLQKMSQDLGISSSIEFLGYRDDSTELMARAEMLVLPSRMEGMPITLLEGMQSHVPIIATRVGGIPTALGVDGYNGILVEPESVTELCSAMKDILENPCLARQKADSAFQLFRDNYGSGKMAQRYLDVYSRVLDPEVST